MKNDMLNNSTSLAAQCATSSFQKKLQVLLLYTQKIPKRCVYRSHVSVSLYTELWCRYVLLKSTWKHIKSTYSVKWWQGGIPRAVRTNPHFIRSNKNFLEPVRRRDNQPILLQERQENHVQEAQQQPRCE